MTINDDLRDWVLAYEKQCRPRDNRSESAKLPLRETPCTGDEPDKHRGGA